MAALAPQIYATAAFVVMAGLVIWGVGVLSRRNREQIKAFAQRANLRVMERSLLGFTSVESLEGEQYGRRIRYWTYSTGAGKSRTSWIAVGVFPRAHGLLKFSLGRQGIGTRIMEWFGAKEIQVGDRAFDERWFVQSNQPEFFAAALMPEIRGQLMAAPERRGGGYKLDADVVQYTEQGYFDGPATLERLEAQLPILHALADMSEVFASSPGR